MADELTRVYNTLAFLNFYKKLRQANRRFAYGRDYARESKNSVRNLPSKWKIRFYKSFRFIKIFMYRIIKDNSVHKNRSSTARTWKLINKLPGTAVHPQ